MSDAAWEIRPAIADDTAFIFNAMLTSYRLSSAAVLKLPKNIYFERHHPKLTAAVARPSTRILVACLPDDPAVLLGFVIAEPEKYLVHYVYTKGAFRKAGIATALVKAIDLDLNQCTVTHWTFVLDDQGINALKRWPEMVYNPRFF